MSDNATGRLFTNRSFFGDIWGSEGSITTSRNDNDGKYSLGWDSSAGTFNSSFEINVSHTHTYRGDIETRPQNYTIKVWKRTA